ncbi:excinuclease ABC subunit UvrA [Granulosicoccaceae sp. 1_MG-2023]|nr:excinuclease ABC subunit UvrA [Granulosicoccaceae sp. 1_MG-2023]
MSQDTLSLRNARQNNLKNLDLDLPHGKLIVVTGVSGSGKSSLAFDTIYSEGQRRYVETFSPYARQFLDRMDRPQVDSISGIPPAIAIDQTNPVRTSRSTVGTMTELNDHLKLLFARMANLYCGGCGEPVRRDTPELIARDLIGRFEDGQALMVTFTVSVPENFTREEIGDWLQRQGYQKIHAEDDRHIEVIQDRLKLRKDNHGRLHEAMEAALRYGRGRARVYPLDAERRPGEAIPFSSTLQCPRCELTYEEPLPSLFSFNSPIGACETCRGFGRVMGIDYNLVIPDESLSLAQGAIKPWQTKTNEICQKDLLRFAKKRGIPTDTPWRDMDAEHQAWVIEGEGDWDDKHWYGVRRFFDWLEGRSYKMHVRVLLSRYRSYTPCPDCGGARLKPAALLWRVGSKQNADAVLDPQDRFVPIGSQLPAATVQQLPGLHLYDLMRLPLADARDFFNTLTLPAPMDEAGTLLLDEIRARLRYLSDVGLGYLTLDRQSRTLSGGEVQRINLTTALGTSLVNTLFVLDEPSIGLHPRDMDRIIRVLQRLRDSGNSLIVVEHDPQVMLAADRILDMGPGPGEAGGEVVFNGTATQLLRSRASLTGSYLRGDKRLSLDHAARGLSDNEHALVLEGANEHNLQNLTVRFPLNRLVCVAGVSGSGKSTLVQDVLYNALSKLKGKPEEQPGQYKALHGAGEIDEVFLVDQSPIGRSSRSNPVSYTGAFEVIRKRFAALPQAKERNYKPGSFSFNSGMKCPACGGNGYEHVEMQFLSDVYLRCPECQGRRYRPELLEIKLFGEGRETGQSIADVLEMTVNDAMHFFAGDDEVVHALEPLAAVGLGYLALGQPVPTLSGGESQRLKLAAHLGEAAKKKRGKSTARHLFLFDEPTTGLHFEDIDKLLKAFSRLIDEGHSLIVIEHNLDVIRNADWIIELGPEGGNGGGRVVFEGTPDQITQCKQSPTGLSLNDFDKDAAALIGRAKASADEVREEIAGGYGAGEISIHHAREHNLKNIDVQLPRDKFTVITGMSGSGKSTIAFDILFNEGQRRYLESLNAYARQFAQPSARPDVEAIHGIPPTVAIEQRTSRGGHKSTVATLTEIYHFLRLLFVKLGTQYCPDCHVPISAQSTAEIRAQLMKELRGKRVILHAPLIVSRKGYYTDLAKWALNKGFSELRVDGDYLPTDAWPRLDRFSEHDIDLPVSDIEINPGHEAELETQLQIALDFGKGMVKVTPYKRGTPSPADERLFSTERACPSCARSFPEPDPRLFSYNSKHGWCSQCFGTGKKIPQFDEEQSGEEDSWLDSDIGNEPCPACHGKRLNPVALAVQYRDRSIADFTAESIGEAAATFGKLKLRDREADIAQDILAELKSRLAFLNQVGLAYLTLDRAAPTLSGGEAQRIRLAAQLGSNLQGVCYILDEPTIGLHPRDNVMLIKTLRELGAKGNTVVVVEHDEDTIRQADHVIDIGPGAGVRGGEVVATGTPKQLIKNKASVTGRSLAHPLAHPLYAPRKEEQGEIQIRNATLNNLKGVSLTIPMNRLVGVSGVSGSGKSTLIREVLRENLYTLSDKKNGKKKRAFSGCDEVLCSEALARVLEVDQTPIGKTPRSCPATYIGFWNPIRDIFANTTEARIRGFAPNRFSFNVKGGRCDACDGQGYRKVEMNFLPDVKVPCEVCGGKRFNSETLSVRYRDKTIADVLNMNVDDAVEFFAAHPKIQHPLQLLQDVGLGYLTLGQQSPTLSGGEAQRIKLVTELAKARPQVQSTASRRRNNHTLYILDEPTVGLHMADVEKLIHVLHRLVDAGNSVIVIEHNLDLLAETDWLIDMGPEGGDGGGKVVAQGTPAKVAASKRSRTAPFLKAVLTQGE